MELVKVFNFSDKKSGFLEIIEVCLNLGIGFCITWLVLPNYKKIVRKNQFQINHASHLKSKQANTWNVFTVKRSFPFFSSGVVTAWNFMWYFSVWYWMDLINFRKLQVYFISCFFIKIKAWNLKKLICENKSS